MTGPTGPTTTLGAATWNDTAGFGLLNPVLAMQRALDDQAIAVESFSETGPIRVSGNTGCGVFTAAGGAAPVANGGGWLVPKGGNVWVLCKGLRGSANLFESKMTLNIEPSAAKGTWYVSINRYRAGTRETIVNNWGWYHDFTSRFDGIWSIKIDELPVAEQSKPIDVYVNIQPSAGVENLTMQRLRIGPPGKL